MKNKVVITGGAGFVGSNLIEYLLLKTKLKIISIDNYSSGSKKNHIKNSRVKYLNGETKTIEWENRDIFVVPCWYPHKFEADTEATIFSFSDKVVQTKLGLFRERRGNK